MVPPFSIHLQNIAKPNVLRPSVKLKRKVSEGSSYAKKSRNSKPAPLVHTERVVSITFYILIKLEVSRSK
jgi:hypothetical protein